MGIYSIKPRFQRSLHFAEVFCIRHGIHPDVLTLAALALSAIGGVALWASHGALGLLWLLPPIAIGRTALNALDGLVAVGSGLARPWGEVLNEFGDRLADVALFTGLAFAPGADPRLGAAGLVLMLLSSYLGTVAKSAGGRRQYGGVMGKADRMIGLSLAAPVAFFLPGWPILTYFQILVLGGLVLTILQRLRAAHADLQSRR